MEHGHESAVQVDVTWTGMVATVSVTGDLDITTAAPLTARLQAVAAGRPEWLVLDLSGLVFADVTCARALHDAHTLLQTVCPVILHEPPPSVGKIFGSPACWRIRRASWHPTPLAEGTVSARGACWEEPGGCPLLAGVSPVA